MAISLRNLAKDLDSRVNPWRASIEAPEFPQYKILYDNLNDELYIASNMMVRLFATRREIDDHMGPDAEWFKNRAQSIMREWESLTIPFQPKLKVGE